jgi:hypothetical protein
MNIRNPPHFLPQRYDVPALRNAVRDRLLEEAPPAGAAPSPQPGASDAPSGAEDPSKGNAYPSQSATAAAVAAAGTAEGTAAAAPAPAAFGAMDPNAFSECRPLLLLCHANV